MYGQEYGSDKSINPIPCAPLLDSLEQQVEFPIHLEEYIKPLSDGSGADMKFKPACNDCLAKLEPIRKSWYRNRRTLSKFRLRSSGMVVIAYTFPEVFKWSVYSTVAPYSKLCSTRAGSSSSSRAGCGAPFLLTSSISRNGVACVFFLRSARPRECTLAGSEQNQPPGQTPERLLVRAW